MDFKSSLELHNDTNKNETEKKNSNNKFKTNKDFSFSNDDENNNPNKIRLTIDKIISINNEKDNLFINENQNYCSNTVNSLYNNEKRADSLNQLTINRLIDENNLLKKEIEIVKSNLIISNEKELLHRKTIQKINKINKEKEKSYKNSMSLIDDYKKREKDLMIKLKEYESDFNKKEEELNNELSILKNELFQKNKIINELQLNIQDLNKQILNLKKLLSEKTKILSLITKKNSENWKVNRNNINDINCTPHLATSKSCKNLDFKNDNNNEMKLKKRDNSLNNLKSYIMNNKFVSKTRGNNSLKFYQNTKNNVLLSANNSESYADNLEGLNDDNFVMHKKKNSFYKKLIPNKGNINNIRIQTLKKNNSYRNINHNSVYSTIKKNQNSFIESSSSMNNNISLSGINLNQYKNLLDKKQIKQFKIKKDMLSQWTRKANKESKRNNITEYNNFSFKLNDDQNIHKIFSNKKIINDGDIGQKIEDNNKLFHGKKNSIVNSISNTKIKNECKKNRIIEINKFYLNNPNIISNSSYRNISYENQK